MSMYDTPFELINRTETIKAHDNFSDWNTDVNMTTVITRVDGDDEALLTTSGAACDSENATYTAVEAEIIGWLDEYTDEEEDEA